MRYLSRSEWRVGLVLSALLSGACYPSCGGPAAQQGPSPRWASRCAVPAPGCLYLENHDTEAVHIVRAGQKPGPANLVPPRVGSVPGRNHVLVDPASVAAVTFTAVSGEVALSSAACSLAAGAWERRNPVLAWRDGALRCEGGK